MTLFLINTHFIGFNLLQSASDFPPSASRVRLSVGQHLWIGLIYELFSWTASTLSSVCAAKWPLKRGGREGGLGGWWGGWEWSCCSPPSPSLTPHFIARVRPPSHIPSNEAKSSMLNGTSQLCH